MTELPFDKHLLDRLTTGITRSLGLRSGVCEIELVDKPPAQRHQMASWEQRNSCFLPQDFKNFYQMCDGILLTWSVKLDGDNVQPVGRMELNSINGVSRIAGEKITRRNNPSLADLEDELEHETDGDCNAVPRFDDCSRVFELDPCQGCGKVCLVYRNTNPGMPAQAQDSEIWFLDTALRWHFLTSSFSQYFRLMMVHLGLPQWQYAFTDVGLGPQVKQWFNLYGPYRLQLDTILTEILGPAQAVSPEETVLHKLDASKVFKGKTDKRHKASSGQPKKKSSALSKPLSGGSTGRSGQVAGSNRFR